MTRVVAAARAGLREYRRTPVLLALFLALPAYSVGLFARLAPDEPATLYLGDGAVRTGMPETFAALMTPMAAALAAGVAGLFLLSSSADADARLVVAGYRPAEVVLARIGQLSVVATAVSAVAVAVALATFTPDHLGWFAAATLLAALVYGALGTLAGAVLSRMAGVYLVLFGTLADLFLFQNPLARDAPDGAAALPGNVPVAVAMDAAFAGGADLGEFAVGAAYLLAVVAAAAAAFYRSARG